MTIQDFMAWGGALVLLGQCIRLIRHWLNPITKPVKINTEKIKDLEEQIDNIDKRLERLQEYSDNDYKSLNSMREMDKAQCAAMLSMINHMIDGNGIKDMKATREAIQEILIRSK